MQRGWGGRGGLFGSGDPSHGSGVFIPPGKPMPSFFGGSSSFNDPFLTNPSGSMVVPSLFEQSIFSSSMFETPRGLNGGVIMNAGGLQQQDPVPSRTQGPIIEELSSDDADVNENDEKKKANHLKHPRISKEPYVEEPDEIQDSKRPKHELVGREYAIVGTSCQQPLTYMFQSSTVTFGGSNGVCYMSSTTMSDGDGVTVKERKEADTTTGKATHRIARGIGNKGHALTRKLDCGGKVNTMQTLHNLNEDELAGFEESWQRNAGQCLPGWDPRVNRHSSGTFHPGVREENRMPALPAPSEMFALPAPEQHRRSNSSRMKRLPLNGLSQGRSRP